MMMQERDFPVWDAVQWLASSQTDMTNRRHTIHATG